MSTQCWTWAATSARDHPGCAARTARRMLSKAVIHGMSEKFWNTTIRSMPGRVTSRPSSTTPPRVGRSRPAMMFSSVDLPHPEWPIIVTNSPRAISSVTSSNTSRPSPRPSAGGKVLLT